MIAEGHDQAFASWGGGVQGSQGQLQWRLQVTHKAVGGSYWRLERLQVVVGQAKA